MSNLLKKIYFYILILLLKLIPIKKNNSFRILMYHNIKKKNFKNFEDQILRLKNNGWKFINPKKIDKQNKKGRLILLTFDDGFISNFQVATNVLKKLNINALFFIPSKLLEISNYKDQKKFISKNLKIKNFKNLKLMKSHHIKKLLNLGHSIGCHTHSHIKFNNFLSSKSIKDDLFYSKKIMEKKFRIKLLDFAYTFGTRKDISEKSFKIINKYFSKIYTGIRGENYGRKNMYFRDQISCGYTPDHVEMIVNGFYDVFYLYARVVINNLIKKYKKLFS